MTHFRSYQEIPIILEQAREENARVYKALDGFLRDFSGCFEEFQGYLSSLSHDPFIFPDKKTPDPCKMHSAVFIKLPRLFENSILPLSSFRIIEKHFQDFATQNITGKTEKYDGMNQNLQESIKATLKRLDKARETYDDMHQKYMQAGFALKQVDIRKPGKVKELQRQFLKAKEIAMSAHIKYQEEMEAISVEMEGHLTEFEEMEQIRISGFQKLLYDLANEFNEISLLIVADVVSSTEEISTTSINDDVRSLIDLNKVRDPETDPELQPIWINPILSSFIDMQKYFAKELSGGGFLMKITQNYDEGSNHLMVAKDEVVVCLQTEGDQMLCKTINETVGWIPSSIANAIESPL